MTNRIIGIRKTRLLALALALAACAPMVWTASSIAQQAPAALPKWPQTGTDLAPDPVTIFGVLPNGMRYAIRHNDQLPGRVAMRMHMAVGSMHEAPDQLGIAHLLEHMAFNGSKNVPEGEVMKMMQRLGSAPGADTNAGTGPQATTYMFNLPNAKDETVDTALMLFRETASELLLTPAAVDRERGVVLSEERLRDSPGLRQYDASMRATYGAHPAGRSPIGTIEILKKVPVARIKAFYDAFYRPERATLLIVGDMDAAAMEAKVKAKFSDWKGRGPAGANPPTFNPALGGPDFAMYTETGVQPQVTVSWLSPVDKTPDTLAKAKTKVIEDLALGMLNRRFTDIAQGPNPPFLVAIAAKAETPGVVTQAQIISAGAKTVNGSIDAMVKAQRQAVEFGFNQAELDRAITTNRAGLQARLAAVPTAPTAIVTQTILTAIEQDNVFRSAKQNLDLFEEVVPTVTLAQVNAALKAVFVGIGPKVFVSDGAMPEGGDAAVRTAFNNASTAPVAALAAVQTAAWPYTSFGAPGKIAKRDQIADLGVTTVLFENGVRLMVKPTNYSRDQVQVRVMFGAGQLDEPKDKVSPLQLWSQAFVSGGLGKIATKDWQRAFAGKSATISTNVGEGGFVLMGNPRPQDLELQMQLLAAYVTDPAWAPNDYETGRSYMATMLKTVDRTPGGAYNQVAPLLLHSGDKRWASPTPEIVQAINVPDIKAAMAPILKDADLEVLIVGDVTVDEAIKQTTATFGALAPRKPRAEPAGSRDVAFPAGTPQPLIVKHKGRADQGIATIAWPATGFFANMEDVAQARVMHLILVDRLQEELREKQGKTYGVQGGIDFSRVFRTYGTIIVSTEIPPDSMPAFYAAVDKVVADLKAKPPTQDELDRAIRPRKEELNRTFITNAYWSTNLIGAQLEPKRIDEIRIGAGNYDKVTGATVQAAAKRWLVSDKAWKMNVVPEAAAQ